jgi:hypothetical protein
MKTKYVFIFDPDDVPYEMERCYIFSNIPDATSFFLNRGFYLDSYETFFTIKNDVKISFKGDIIKGKYF